MNTPESICVDFPTAQKLKEAGFPQDKAVYYWCDYDDPITRPRPDGEPSCEVRLILSEMAIGEGYRLCEAFHCFAAPTLEEVLREFPVYSYIMRAEKEWLADFEGDEESFSKADWNSPLVAAARLYLELASAALLPDKTEEI